MSDQSPLEPLVLTGLAGDEAASDATTFGPDGNDRGVPYPVAPDRQAAFLGDLDDFLYSVSEEEGV